MRRNFIWVCALALFLMTASHSQADNVLFDFFDDAEVQLSDALDGAGVGAAQVGDLLDGTLNTTLTTIDILTPEFEDNGSGVFVRTGNILSAAAGEGGETNIAGNRDALGINNESISSAQFETAEGLTTGGVEGSDWNDGESWVFSFDQDVTFQMIETESFLPTNVLEVLVDGVLFETFTGIDDVTTFTNTAVIPAGSEITFAASGDLVDTDFRIESFTVDTVAAVNMPEPEPEPETGPIEYDVYIIAGQSNADGRAMENDLPAGSPLAGVQDNVIISYLNPGEPGEDAAVSSEGFVSLEPGFSVAPGEDRSLGVPSATNYFGLEISFATAIGQATESSNPIAIIKVTRGGTSLRADWRVGAPAEPGVETGFLYTALLSHIQTSLDQLTFNGDQANIRGFLWHQGESDRNSVSAYSERFTDLVEGVRANFGEDIPFVLGELSQEREDNAPFNDNLADLVNASAVPNLGLVASEGLTTTDTTHFDTPSQLTLGERFATAIAAFQTPEDPEVLLGDVDINGQVNFADIPAFIQVLTDGTFQLEADVNEDGNVNFSDIPAFVAVLTAQ